MCPLPAGHLVTYARCSLLIPRGIGRSLELARGERLKLIIALLNFGGPGTAPVSDGMI